MKEPWEYLNKLINETPGLTLKQYTSKFNEYEQSYHSDQDANYTPHWTESGIMRLIKTVNDHPNTFHTIGPFNCLNNKWYCSRSLNKNSTNLFVKISELETEIKELRQQITLLQNPTNVEIGDSGI